MSFCTAINCMDGRVQLPVIEYLTSRLSVQYVDMITEPGPVRALSDLFDTDIAESIFSRVQVSIDAHQSDAIVLIAHADCAGNPVDDDRQKTQLHESVRVLAERFGSLPVFGLWIGPDWTPQEICALPASQSASTESWNDWEPPGS